MYKSAQLLALVLLLSACSATHVSQPGSTLVSKVEAPLHAEISVGNKIYGVAKNTKVLGVFNFGPHKFADGVNYGTDLEQNLRDEYAEIKAAAAYQATHKAKADVIIAPRYIIESHNYVLYKTTVARVEGYKGIINRISKQ